jgi:peptidoglycan hydrolase CwlO-like protein
VPVTMDPEQQRRVAMALGLIPDPAKLAAENERLRKARDAAAAEAEAARQRAAAAEEEAARLRAAQAPPPAPAPAPAAAAGARQWTDDDVHRSSPRELVAAMDAGLLENLGFGKTRRGHYCN